MARFEKMCDSCLKLERVWIGFQLNEQNKTKLESVKKADYILELPEEVYLVIII